jgi:cytochrome c551/c552
MTFSEKAKEFEEKNGTKITSVEIVENHCPCDYEFEKVGDAPVCYGGDEVGECEKCWNREVPTSEPSCDDVKAAYDQGLNDAWELVKRILGIIDKENHELMPAKELIKIYGTSDLLDIFVLAPQEALAKLKAYEDSKIEVGDVLVYQKRNGIVVDFKGNRIIVLSEIGIESWYECDIDKTGKHIDIRRFLQQIGE